MIYNFIVGILCSIFTVLPIYKLFKIKENIKKCWPSIKCTPLGQLLFPFFGPKNISSSQNQQICDSSKFSTMFDAKIKNINNGVNVLNSAVASINNDINGVKNNIYNIRKTAINNLKNVSKTFLKTYQRINNLGIVVFKTVKDILNIFKYLLTTTQMAYYSIESIWSGPIGASARFFGGIL